MDIAPVTLIEIFLVVFVLMAIMSLISITRYVLFGHRFPRVFIWQPSDAWPKWTVAVWALIILSVSAYILTSFFEDMSSHGIFPFGIGEKELTGIFSSSLLSNSHTPLIGGQ